MADSSPSPGNTAADVSAPPSDISSAESEAGSSEQSNPQYDGTHGTPPPEKSAPKAEAKPKPKPKVEAKEEPEAPADDDDPEEDIDGERIRRSELKELYKRRKEFERASHARMQEAAKLRKEAAEQERKYQQAFERLDEDPWAVHRARGWSEEQIAQAAEMQLTQAVKRAQMTPEQREAEANAAELRRLQQELEQTREQHRQQTQAALKQKYVSHWDQKIAQAMEAGNLARTSSTGAKVAQVISEYLQAGEEIDPRVAAEIVRDNHHNEIRHEFTELRQQVADKRITPERFVAYVSDLIGADTVKELQKAAIAKARDFEPQKPKVAPKPTVVPKQGFDSFEEAQAWIAKQSKQRVSTNG